MAIRNFVVHTSISFRYHNPNEWDARKMIRHHKQETPPYSLKNKEKASINQEQGGKKRKKKVAKSENILMIKWGA